MSLRIKKSPELQKKLANLAVEDLKSIKKAGKDLKHTKFYHVEMDKEGARIISSPDAYFGPFIHKDYIGDGEKNSNIVKIKNADTDRDYFYYCSVSKSCTKSQDGMTLYNTCASNPLKNYTDVHWLANVAKMLDDEAIAYYDWRAREAEQVRQIIGGLFDSFGIK